MDIINYALILVVVFIGGFSGYHLYKKHLLKKQGTLNIDSEDNDTIEKTNNNLNPVTIETQEFDYQYFDEATEHTSENDFSGYSPHSEIEEKIQMLINNAHALDKTNHKEHAISYLEDAHNIMVKNLLSTRRINQFNEIINFYKDNETSLANAISTIEDKYEKASIQEIFGSSNEPIETSIAQTENPNNEGADWLEQEANKIRNNEDDVELLLSQVITPEPEVIHHPSIEELMENIHKNSTANKDDDEINYEKELLENINTKEDVEKNKQNFQKSNKEELEKFSDAILNLDKEIKKNQ